MKRFPGYISVCLLALVFSFAVEAMAQSTAPDNTKSNARDRDTGKPTADQQKNNRSDTEITRLIRRSITDDKALSTYARNVKIVTQNGTVTLRGPVRSEVEKRSIEEKAANVAGMGHVKNEIEIAVKKPLKR